MPSRALMVCLVVSLVGGTAAAAPPPELLEVFQQRQNLVRNMTVRLELKLSMSAHAAAQWEKISTTADEGAEPASGQPSLEMQLTCDPQRYHLQVDGLSPNFNSHRFEQTTETYTANGSDYRWLRRLAPDYHFTAQGVILSEGSALGRLELQPLMWGLQPLRNSSDTANLSQLRPFPLKRADAGDCLVLIDRNGQREWWFDPAAGYSMVRYMRRRMEQDSLWADIRIQNVPHETLGWVPDSWTVTRFNRSGDPRWVYAVKVSEIQLNQPLSDELFELEFPAGTLVTDGRGKRNDNWIVSNQPVSTATGIYQSGNRTAPPPPAAAGSSGSFIMLLIAAGATLLVLLLSASSVRRNRGEAPTGRTSRVAHTAAARYSASA